MIIDSYIFRKKNLLYVCIRKKLERDKSEEKKDSLTLSFNKQSKNYTYKK
jgi:hypothetical protein